MAALLVIDRPSQGGAAGPIASYIFLIHYSLFTS